MKITIENYKDVFSRLNNELNELVSNNNNKEVADSFKKIKEEFEEIQSSAEQLKSENGILKIGIVGQVKAGKSSFLNSLFFDGENVLPRASTPMTAGLTILEYGEENLFRIEYYNEKEWGMFKSKSKQYDDLFNDYKSENATASEADFITFIDNESLVAAHELVSSCSSGVLKEIEEKSKIVEKKYSDIKDLQGILEDYVGANGKYTSIVKSLTVVMHDKRLDGLQIVDTPGVNDPVLSREQRTREFLRGCHGVFFLSYAGRFFDSTDVEFLENRVGDQGIGTVILIASKFDSVLQDVGMKFNDNLSDAIDDCKRNLKKQFKNNIDNSNFRGDDPIIDFSSGIGFSIAKKDPGRRDSIENQVVKQLKCHYPSFFGSEEEIRELCFDLSNIDVIRENYLKGVFEKNKVKIISEKTNSYFENSSLNLKKKISQQKEQLNIKHEILKNGEISSLERQNAAYSKIIDAVKDEMKFLTKEMEISYEICLKECCKLFDFSPSLPLPRGTAEETFYRKTTFWASDTRFSCSYKVIDCDKAVSKLVNELKCSLNILSKKWDADNEKIRESIQVKIDSIIDASEKECVDVNINPRLLKSMANETLDMLKLHSILRTDILVEEFKVGIQNILQVIWEINYNVKQEEETTTRRRIDTLADKIITERTNEVKDFCKVVYKDVENELLKKAIGDSIKSFAGNKDRFIEEVKRNINSYTDNLKKDLSNKEKQLENMNNSIGLLTRLEEEL